MTDLPTIEFLELLDAQFDEVTPTRVAGRVAADVRPHQPWGIAYGGPYASAVETFATVGAFTAVQGQAVVGVFNATDFLRPHVEGRLDVVARPVHQGRTQWLRTVEPGRGSDGKLVARGQIRRQNIG